MVNSIQYHHVCLAIPRNHSSRARVRLFLPHVLQCFWMGSLYQPSSRHEYYGMCGLWTVCTGRTQPHHQRSVPRDRAPRCGRMICCEVSVDVLDFAFEIESPRPLWMELTPAICVRYHRYQTATPFTPTLAQLSTTPLTPCPSYASTWPHENKAFVPSTGPRRYISKLTNQSAAEVTNAELLITLMTDS